MIEFTGWQYLLIDAANNNSLGGDKWLFEERIEWAETNLTGLDNDIFMSREWKEKPLYIKAVMAIREAQAGLESGHLVGFDAICSGMQIMSAVTGCLSGAQATGLVDQNVRSDAYTQCAKLMIQKLGYKLEHARQRLKDALMTALYGSQAEPEKVFGKDTAELNAFWKAMYTMAPGAAELLHDLLDSWQPWALVHWWDLPDGYLSYVKVIQKKELRVEVEELGGSSFTYQFYENKGEKKGVKNAANVVHSIDAYLLRTLLRRCNYDVDQFRFGYNVVTDEILERQMGMSIPARKVESDDVRYYLDLYKRHNMADLAILPALDREQTRYLSDEHLAKLQRILDSMMLHKPFAVITVHDEFKCHANNMNHLRYHYKEILADLADSTILSSIFSQLHGRDVTYKKLSANLGDIIRKSNYHLS